MKRGSNYEIITGALTLLIIIILTYFLITPQEKGEHQAITSIAPPPQQPIEIYRSYITGNECNGNTALCSLYSLSLLQYLVEDRQQTKYVNVPPEYSKEKTKHMLLHFIEEENPSYTTEQNAKIQNLASTCLKKSNWQECVSPLLSTHINTIPTETILAYFSTLKDHQTRILTADPHLTKDQLQTIISHFNSNGYGIARVTVTTQSDHHHDSDNDQSGDILHTMLISGISGPNSLGEYTFMLYDTHIGANYPVTYNPLTRKTKDSPCYGHFHPGPETQICIVKTAITDVLLVS